VAAARRGKRGRTHVVGRGVDGGRGDPERWWIEPVALK
jgi:hypothetical protein